MRSDKRVIVVDDFLYNLMLNGLNDFRKGDVVRLVQRDQIPDPQQQRAQPVLNRVSGFGFNAAVVDQAHPVPLGPDDAPSHQRVSRINPQHRQVIAPFPCFSSVMVSVVPENVKANRKDRKWLLPKGKEME